jgi:hypothetical protein
MKLYLLQLVHQVRDWYSGVAIKWVAGKARRGSISKSVRDRGATQPPAHFHRNPPGRASFGRLLCRSSSRNTRRRRYTSHGLGALGLLQPLRVPAEVTPIKIE